jgi:hypothetical protein
MGAPQGINSLVGSFDARPAEGATRDAAPSASGFFSPNKETDGTEYLVGAIVLAALLLLILFRVGGFQAVIAAK